MTTQKKTTYLDLDAIVPENEVVLKFRGKDHPLAPISLGDFIRNRKQVDEAGDDLDPQTEMSLIRDMLTRSFPTMSGEDMDAMSLLQLNKLLEFAMENNGAQKVETEAAEEAADPK